MHGTPARVLAQHLGRNLRFKGSPLCEHPAVKPTAPLSRHYPHNARDSGSSLSFPGTTLIMHGTPARVLAQHLGSKFALQRCVADSPTRPWPKIAIVSLPDRRMRRNAPL